MYINKQFGDRHFLAVSVPPPCDPTLSEDFKELSKIHFYLGRAPINFMIDAVEKASLEDIQKGTIQLYFASKEIQEFLSSSWSLIKTFNDASLDPSFYFNIAFSKILKDTLSTLNDVYKNPTDTENVSKTDVMLTLSHEVEFLISHLNKIGIKIDDQQDVITSIKKIYATIFNLKQNYSNLDELNTYDFYKEKAEKSILAQLNSPYEFDYQKLASIYLDRDDWIRTVSFCLNENKKLNETNCFDYEISKQLKNTFLTQIKSFNRLFENGVINYVLYFAVAISREKFINSEKSKVSAQSYFQRQIDYHNDSIKRHINPEHSKKELKKLYSIKDEFIAQKIDDKTFYSQYLTTLHRQEQNILLTIDKLKNQLLNYKNKETITLTGDIDKGFVIGEFSNSENIVLIHKDPFVDVAEAVYFMVISKDKYIELKNNNNLVFDMKNRESLPIKASNFYSYGQFLQELSDPYIQKRFLGCEFDLIDNTVISHQAKNNKTKRK